ncbi:40S ribosomal protein [Hortaea werneckii]|nr:40S ribosomal protein [Hortaea werneckii]
MVKHEAQRSPYSDSSSRRLINHEALALALTEDVAVLFERAASKLVLGPQVGSQEAVGVGDGGEGSLEGVLKGLGRTGRGSVGVVNTSKLQQTLDGRGGDKAGTTGSRDQLSKKLLDRNGVRLTKVGTPVTTTDGDNSQLGDDDGGADGGGHFLGGLDTETNVTLAVTDDNDGFEAGTLTGTGLLLDWLDLYHRATLAIAPNLRFAPENPLEVLKLVHDLVLLDREGVEVDLLHALNLAGLYETTELGDGLPFLLVALRAAASATAAATATSTVTATATVAEATAGCSTSVGHCRKFDVAGFRKICRPIRQTDLPTYYPPDLTCVATVAHVDRLVSSPRRNRAQNYSPATGSQKQSTTLEAEAENASLSCSSYSLPRSLAVPVTSVLRLVPRILVFTRKAASLSLSNSADTGSPAACRIRSWKNSYPSSTTISNSSLVRLPITLHVRGIRPEQVIQ